jgi:hypothetical protein
LPEIVGLPRGDLIHQVWFNPPWTAAAAKAAY